MTGNISILKLKTKTYIILDKISIMMDFVALGFLGTGNRPILCYFRNLQNRMALKFQGLKM